MKKCIIFDCDGVLVDSEILANKVGVEMLEKLGCALSVEECIKQFTGLNDQSERELLARNHNIHLPENFFIERQQAILKAFETELTPLMFNVLNFLKTKKVDIAVASSSPRARVIRALQLTNQFDFFQENSIFTSQQVKNGKPAPDLFLYAANQMNHVPQNCMVLEDSPAGIMAAMAANMQVLGFLAGSHAQYDWYHKKISDFEIPTVHQENDLIVKLTNFIDNIN